MSTLPDLSALENAKVPERRLLYVALAGIAVGVAIYLVWAFHVEPISGWVNTFMVNIKGFATALITGVLAGVNGFLDYFNRNPVPAIGSVLAGTSAVVSLVGKLKADQAKNTIATQAAQAETAAQKKLIDMGQQWTLASKKVGELEAKLKAYETDPFFAEARGVIDGQKKQIEEGRQQIEALHAVIADLKVKEIPVVMVH